MASTTTTSSSSALQEADRSRHTGIAVFWQWSAISVDKENRVVVWNELDMTSAFYVFRQESAWYKFQAMAKPVSGQFASRWVPNLWAEESVYPAVAVMAMGKKSSCGLLNRFTGSFVSSPSPWNQRWTHPERFGAMVPFREAAGHMLQASFRTQFRELCAPASSG